ncbi:SDR family oxidoreductase [Nocardia sp. BMG111209]|uniref:SDR family oxidoreductase n=1 Tax=Nocardia sp. BMG111209 TaxID=1160137 RepID=UPI0003745E42|nr:SDR family oxidoreductase [Nocardia sp. BMG111209]
MRIIDSVAVVTGAAGGIGAAIAQRLLEQGGKVALSDISADRLAATVAELADRFPGRVLGRPGDAAAETDLVALIDSATTTLGPVDLFFANAGVGGGPGLAATDAQWEQALSINLMGHVRAARLMVPQWLERGSGYFVGTASAAGLLTQIGSATYSASKHAAVGFAEWLAVTYGDRGVRVSCLCPMGVDTALLTGFGTDEAADTRLAARAVTGAGKVLQPLDVADRVLEAVAAEQFLILPHPEVAEFLRRKTSDHDRWIHGMQRYRVTLES